MEDATGKTVCGSLTVQNRLKCCHWDKMVQIVYSDGVYKKSLVDCF